MRYWERLKLRGRRGKIGRGDINRDGEANGGDRPPAEQSNEAKKSPAGEGNQRKERKHGTTAEVIIAFVTIMLFVVAWKQNGIQSRQADISQNQFALSGRQYEFTTNEAAASSNIAAASLNVSQTAATATADQAVAMKEMARAADKQATAAVQQAAAATRQLALTQQAKIDVDVKVASYGGDIIHADGVIVNSASYSVKGTEYIAFQILHAIEPPEKIWSFPHPPKTVEITGGNSPHLVPMQLSGLDQEVWGALATGKLYAAFALKFEFRDAAGIKQVREQCLMIYGPPENYHPDDCANYRSQLHGPAPTSSPP